MKRLALLTLLLTATVLGAPTQEDVFKSIQDSVGDTVDPNKFFAMLLGIAGICIIIALLSRKQKREIAPKALNHPGKLIKEAVKQIQLKPAEVKQLRTLAEVQGVTNPLTLLLCPSVLGKAIKSHPAKVDRAVITALAKRLQRNA